MRQIHVVASAFGMFALAGACASPTGGASSSSLDPSPSHDQSRIYEGAARDSLIAQAVADRQGPAASIHAEVSNAADSRRLRAVFHLDDDAYVVVGQIGADGVLRIVFPVDPGDDGFVKGNKTYQTNEFFAGFNDEFRYRARQTGLFRDVSSANDSYDGGLGYVFIVASWRPMRFTQFSTDGKWDSFEIADQTYMRDPRPAINELASLLAGENREAYTVQYARSYTTLALTDASSGLFNSGYCSGYQPLGFDSSPFGAFGYNGIGIGYSPFLSYGSNFYYRGQEYYYSAFGDCYVPGGYGGFGYGYNVGYIAQGIPVAPFKHPHIFDLDHHHSPPVPQPVDKHRLQTTVSGQDAGAASSAPQTAHYSAGYRQRGLITPEDPKSGPERGQPGVGARFSAEDRLRPSIQDMINRRGQDVNGAGASSRLRMQTNSDGSMRASQIQQQQMRTRSEPTSSGERRGSSRPEPSARTESPRMSAPPASHATPSAAPASHPSAPAPASAPASSSSSGRHP
jgi:hypothetical protein